MKRNTGAAQVPRSMCKLTFSDAACLIAASLLIALMSGTTRADPALAAAGPPETQSTEGKTELEEVTVTAEKRESTVQATPISITALTGKIKRYRDLQEPAAE